MTSATTFDRHRPLDGPSCWTGAHLATSDEWTIKLTERHRTEIVAATAAALQADFTPENLRVDDFALPSLTVEIERWSSELSTGRGFILVRNFPVDGLTPDETALAYVGLGLHLGDPVSQNAHGDRLTSIRDERLGEQGPHIRLYRTNKRQEFHTDGSDLVGLLCLHKAASGGESRIASSAAVYNEVLRRRPDLLDVLYDPMPWDRNDEQRSGEDPYFLLPPLFEVAGSPRFFFIGWYVRDSQRHPSAPRLTDAQMEALAFVEEIANDPQTHLEMRFEPGDIQFINNATILHSREAYEDDPDPARRRHLLRLWLAARRFAAVDEGLRGGIARTR